MRSISFIQKIVFGAFLILICWSFSVFANLGQTIQIDTRLTVIWGQPIWLLELRNEETGKVLPYIFDFRQTENHWVAFSMGKVYRVVASTLTFGPYAKIHNFCGLESGILKEKSIQVRLRGELSPDPTQVKCYVRRYRDIPFTMVSP